MARRHLKKATADEAVMENDDKPFNNSKEGREKM
jgi:hypothetical protein